MYVAKKPYRYNVSWNHIDAVGAVFGSKTIEINGKTYKVRLLKASPDTGNIYTGSNGYDPVGAYGSEWNRLMYPIHSGIHTDTQNPTPITGEGLHFGTLAQYTDADLVVHSSGGNGYRSWCQETPSTNSTIRVNRGDSGVSYLFWVTVSSANLRFGWRPVLELIP